MPLRNYTGANYKYDVKTFLDVAANHFDYCKFSEEKCPTTGRTHIQWWGQSTRQVGTLRHKFGHVEECKGTPEQNEAYVSKPESHVQGPFKFGEISEDYVKPKRSGAGQGTRTDLKRMLEDIKNGADEKTIMENYTGDYLRMNRTIREMIDRWGPDHSLRTIPREVIWIVGKSGCGKTTYAHNCCTTDKYVLSNQDNTMWWRGYRGQKNVIIDDFKGGIKYSTLLGICDPKFNPRVAVASGGDLTWFTADKVYITSTLTPELAFPDRTEWSELLRRITVQHYNGASPPQAPPEAVGRQSDNPFGAAGL